MIDSNFGWLLEVFVLESPFYVLHKINEAETFFATQHVACIVETNSVFRDGKYSSVSHTHQTNVDKQKIVGTIQTLKTGYADTVLLPLKHKNITFFGLVEENGSSTKHSLYENIVEQTIVGVPTWLELAVQKFFDTTVDVYTVNKLVCLRTCGSERFVVTHTQIRQHFIQ